MATAVYRGVSYDTEARTYNDLVLMKKKIECQLAKKEALMTNTRHQS